MSYTTGGAVVAGVFGLTGVVLPGVTGVVVGPPVEPASVDDPVVEPEVDAAPLEAADDEPDAEDDPEDEVLGLAVEEPVGNAPNPAQTPSAPCGGFEPRSDVGSPSF